MAVIVKSLSNHQIAAFQDQFVEIYRDAFSAPPYCKGEGEVIEFAWSLPLHVEREGFRLVVAEEDGTSVLVGFAYGTRSTPGQFWHEAVGPWIAAEWLVNSFQFIEIAVAPRAQGQGIGGLLHDHLLDGLPYRKALLSTMAAETSAYGMYQKRGWQVLVEGIIFLGVARTYRVMGLELGEDGA